MKLFLRQKLQEHTKKNTLPFFRGGVLSFSMLFFRVGENFRGVKSESAWYIKLKQISRIL
jgi:hypothetical protein